MDASSQQKQNTTDPYRESVTPEESNDLKTRVEPEAQNISVNPEPLSRFSKDDILLRAHPENKVQQKPLVAPEELGQQVASKLAARAAFRGASTAPEEQTPQTPPQARSLLHTIRTYRGDVEDVVQTKNISMISVVAAEEERKAKEKSEDQTRKKSLYTTVFYSLGTMVLIGGGIALAAYAYLLSIPEDPTIPLATSKDSLVFTEKSNFHVLKPSTREGLMSILMDVKTNDNNSLGTFERIIITSASTSTDDIVAQSFFEALKAGASAAFTRSLGKGMLIGVHSYGTTESFLIFQSLSYDQSFAGMLQWEKTMREDLSPFFDLATSTVDTPFEDAVIRNKDARVIRTQDGAIVFLYSFPDQKTLVIAEHPDTLVEIIRRLSSTKSIGG